MKEYIHSLDFNKMILISAANGIVEYYNRSILKKYGGCLELSRVWDQSLMSRLGFIKRKGAQAVRKLPDDTPTIKLQFLEKIKSIVTTHKIPDQLVFN